MNAQDIIEMLSLEPHPEGGYFRETFRDEDEKGHSASTAIYFLLDKGQRSHWHRVMGSSEVWHHYSGDPLTLRISADGLSTTSHTLGTSLADGQRPQIVVPPDCWQSAESLGEWSLVGCTVAPGFDFNNFELAPPNWSPQDV